MSRISGRVLLPTAITLLAFAATSNAQLNDLPDLATVTEVLGATTGDATPSATRASAASATASKNAATKDAVATTASAVQGGLTNAPTLYGVGVPPLIVPNTSGAPFMHKSDLPEGFVFICVGAALAFCAACVLAWRGLVAWSLHRSVKRTASDRYRSEKKSTYAAPSDYSSAYYSTDVSLENLTAKDSSYKIAAGARKENRSISKPAPRNTRQPSSNLFFSPTAGGGQHTAAKSSTYLPAGYYASTGSVLAGGSSMAKFGGPSAAGYGRLDPTSDSPPATPERRGGARYDRSMSRERLSTLDVAQRDGRRQSNLRASTYEPAARAPSAVLDELFDTHTGMR